MKVGWPSRTSRQCPGIYRRLWGSWAWWKLSLIWHSEALGVQGWMSCELVGRKESRACWTWGIKSDRGLRRAASVGETKEDEFVSRSWWYLHQMHELPNFDADPTSASFNCHVAGSQIAYLRVRHPDRSDFCFRLNNICCASVNISNFIAQRSRIHVKY